MSQPEADQDLKDMLNEEIQCVDDAIAAPNRPFVRNFEAESEVEQVRAGASGGAANASAAQQQDIHGFSLRD